MVNKDISHDSIIKLSSSLSIPIICTFTEMMEIIDDL